MHIAEVVTIAKSLPLLRLNTYKSLILSYSADYRRILLQKEWMYRGVMLRIMSPGRFCLQGRAYRFHPVSMREAWQVCFVRSFRNSKCGFPPFGPSDSRSGACQTQRTRTHLRSGSLCLTLRFIYTRLPPLRAFRKLAKAGPVLRSDKWF